MFDLNRNPERSDTLWGFPVKLSLELPDGAVLIDNVVMVHGGGRVITLDANKVLEAISDYELRSTRREHPLTQPDDPKITIEELKARIRALECEVEELRAISSPSGIVYGE